MSVARARGAAAALLLLLAAASGGTALGCSCRNAPLDDAGVRAAGQVFVFRLLSAAAEAQQGDVVTISSITGTIQIVDQLRGEAQVPSISYWTSICCGIRMDVGSYYAAFASGVTGTLEADAGNLLALGDRYTPNGSDHARLADLLAGKQSLDQLFAPAGRDRLLQMPPPPPPCAAAAKATSN